MYFSSEGNQRDLINHNVELHPEDRLQINSGVTQENYHISVVRLDLENLVSNTNKIPAYQK